MSVRFFVRVAVRIVAAWKGDRDAAARAREAEVGPDTGTSLAGCFNTAGHATRVGSKKRVLGLGLAHRRETTFKLVWVILLLGFI